MIQLYHNGGTAWRQTARGLGHWTDAKAQQEFTALYDALRTEAWAELAQRGVRRAPCERDVETPFGPTHVFEWPGEGPPTVLLHGAGTASLMWVPLLAELGGLRVCAIDGVGEPSLSTQTSPVRDVEDLVTWLDAVFDALRFDVVHLVGASYGGWIGLHFTLAHPERVATLTLVEPALTRIRPWFWTHGAAVGVALALPSRLRRPILRRLRMRALADSDPRVVRLGRLGLMKYRRGVPGRVVPVTDDELAAIIRPTLLLLGARSEIHHAKGVAARARAYMRDVRIDVVADAGHSLPIDRPDVVAHALRHFLAAPHGPAD